MYIKTEEQELVLESLREMLTREFTDSYYAQCDAKGEYPFKLAQAMLDNGFTLMGVPEEYGGTPCDIMTLCLMFEELGKNAVPYASVMSALTVCDILMFGTEDQKKRVIDAVAKDGVNPCSLGITEPQAGSDDSSIASTYERRDGKIFINGHKTFITTFAESPICLFIAKDPQVPEAKKSFTCFMVDSRLPGITCSKIHKAGFNSSPAYEVVFNDVQVTEADIVGKEHEGFLFAMKNFEAERLISIAGGMGWAECAFEDAARYANVREQFGKPIGSFQLTQKKITQMYIKLENMRNMVYNCAQDIDAGRSARISSAMCKYYCGKATQEVIDDAMQVLGAIGYAEDHRVSRLWRASRCNRIGGGTDEIMIHILGRQLLKQFK